MAAETLVINAGGLSKTIGLTAADATRLSGDPVFDWGDPQPKRATVETRYGSEPLDAADYENRTITFGLESQITSGMTELTSRQWLQGWQQIAGAVNAATDATLVRTFPTSSTLTARLVSMKVTPAAQLDLMWHRGIARATVTLEALPDLRGPQQTLSGSTATTGGVKAWTGSAAVPGDLPALAEVTATWTSAERKEAVAWAGGAAPTIVKGEDMTYVAPGADTTGGTGAANTNVAAGTSYSGIDATPSPILSFAPGLAGKYEIDARVRCDSDQESATFTLFVESSEIARRAIKPGSSQGGWRVVRFGAVDLRASDRLYLALSGPKDPTLAFHSQSWAVDYAELAPTIGATSATIAAQKPQTSYPIAGDIASVSGVSNGSTINGHAGTIGGTWTATGWTYSSSALGYVATTTGAASIGSFALPATLNWGGSLPGGAGSLGGKFSLRSGATTVFSVEVTSTSATAASIAIYDGSATTTVTTSAYTPSDSTLNFEARSDGAWSVYLYNLGADLSTSPVTGYSSALDSFSGTLTARMERNGASGTITTTGISVQQGYAYDDTIVWSNTSPDVALGDFPTFPAGQTPRVIIRGGVTEADTPASPNPSSLTVKATPRYLQVPEA